MNKSHRPSVKPKLGLPLSIDLPIKKNKHEGSDKKKTPRKVKGHPFRERSKQE